MRCRLSEAGDSQMRRMLLTTVAVVVTASPAFATGFLFGGYQPGGVNGGLYSQREIAGDLEIGLYCFNPDNEKSNFKAFRGVGTANVPVGNSWNLLFETGGVAFFDDGESEAGIGATAHLWKGNGSNLRWGVLAGAGFYDFTFGKIGAEVEFDVTARITLGAQGTYNFSDGDDLWYFRGWGDYYFTQNTKLTAEIAYADWDGGDAYGVGTRLTHRVAGTPLSVYAEADYADFDWGDAWSLGGGFTVILDKAGTQESYDKNSAPFDTMGGALLLGVNF